MNEWEGKLCKEVAFVTKMLGKSEDNAERLQSNNVLKFHIKK